LNSVTLKRKQRIAKVRKERMIARNKKVTLAAVAGAVSLLVFMNGKAGACACSTHYTVAENDTLYSLAKRHGVSVNQLKEANLLESDKIYIGQQLLVPDHPVVPQIHKNNSNYTVKKGDTLFSLAKKYSTTVSELKKENSLTSDRIMVGQKIKVPGAEVLYGSEELYTVYPGDTLWGIAKRFGVKAEELAKVNGLKHEMVLIGQRLIIPGETEFTEAKIVGSSDSFTVEFEHSRKYFVLKVPYGSAFDYQGKSGQDVIVIHKNGALISAF
jgi:LysM repeat protein